MADYVISEHEAVPEVALRGAHAGARRADATGAYWICATDVDATVDIPFSVGGADYRVIANVSQRETMDETCHECTGIEGCDY